MTTGTELTPAHSGATTAGRPSRVGLSLLAIAGIGLAAWLGVRIREATQKQAAVAAQAEQQARVAAEQTGRVVPKATVRGKHDTWQPSVPVEGTLSPMHEADLGFAVGGKLATIDVRVGDLVAPGGVLATLRMDDVRAQLQAAEAQVKAAEAQLAIARDASERTSPLVDAGAAPEATGVAAANQMALAAAQLDAARAQLLAAKLRLDDHALHAQFAGTVTRVPTGVGGVVAPGMPLFHLADTAKLKLVGSVGEADAHLVERGQIVEIDGGERAISGKVTAVLATLDPATRRVPIEAEVANDPGSPVRAGGFVRARARAKDALPVLRLPATALRPGSQDEIVVVKGGKADLRHVAFALADDGSLLVRSGLDDDEDVLESPSSEVKGGDAIVTQRQESR